ncbi:hypothetical protein D3797_012905 [Bacillus subtilis]|nr:hypothetical protein D3797_012905 [Bacillus subtilis]
MIQCVTPHSSYRRKKPLLPEHRGVLGQGARIYTHPVYPLSFSASLDCFKESIELRLLFQKRNSLSTVFSEVFD